MPFNDPQTLREAVNETTAAILFEPVQGEGGINTATPEFFAEAAKLRDEFDLLLMFDEVQCGAGRTGDWCGWRTVLADSGVSVEPDAVSWAKGFAGGFPMGSFWVSDEHAAALGPRYARIDLRRHAAGLRRRPRRARRDREGGRPREREAPGGTHPRRRPRSGTFAILRELRGVGLMLGFVLDAEAMAPLRVLPNRARHRPIFVVNAAREAGC